jgi:phosphoribosylamine-glycine ligase
MRRYAAPDPFSPHPDPWSSNPTSNPATRKPKRSCSSCPLLTLPKSDRIPSIFISSLCAAIIAIVLASQDQPGKYEKGIEIAVKDVPWVVVFHAGTKGRTTRSLRMEEACSLSVPRGDTLEDALALAYKGLDAVDLDSMTFRRDIPHR